MQCFVIITSRSLLWILLTLVSTLAVLSAILSSRWIVGPEHEYNLSTPLSNTSPSPTALIAANNDFEVEKLVRRYSKTLGLFTRCVLIRGREQCAPFIGLNEAEGGAGFPIPWQISMIFLVLGVVVGILTTVAALLGCCVQAVCGKKSLYSVAGAAQAAAGVLYIVGIMMFPFGFGSDRVRRLCGANSSPFFVDDCTLGWSFYVATFGILGTFICAILSAQADKAVSSDKIQEEIDDGKILICLP